VVRDIPAAGRTLTLSKDVVWALEAATAACDGEPLSFEGTLEVRANRDEVRVRGAGDCRYEAACARCGTPTEVALSFDERLLYLPAGSDQRQGEIELSEKDLDVGWYDDGVLDLAAVVSELVALEQPLRVVCEQDCGEPPVVKASEPEPIGHPAFRALKDLI
jgi:uncharacterized metal-binding protein YceD (DUF177 family)